MNKNKQLKRKKVKDFYLYDMKDSFMLGKEQKKNYLGNDTIFCAENDFVTLNPGDYSNYLT